MTRTLLRSPAAPTNGFATHAPLASNAPPAKGAQEFDPEIVDMAQYVHNYKIDSDLAVRFHLPLGSD